jgi:hypothetical protein
LTKLWSFVAFFLEFSLAALFWPLSFGLAYSSALFKRVVLTNGLIWFGGQILDSMSPAEILPKLLPPPSCPGLYIYHRLLGYHLDN